MFGLNLLTLIPLFIIGVCAAPTERQNGLQIIRNCYQSGQIALTFDDGPNNKEADIARALNSVGGKGTFFLNGRNYGCIYDRAQVIKDLSAQGHTLGSHSWSHANMANLQEWQIHQELEKVETAMIKILGLKPLYFRPPYGAYNDLVLKVLAQRGYKKVFLWSDDSRDSLGASSNEQKSTFDNIARQFPSPKLVLQHSTVDSSVDTTYYAVNKLKSAGYKMVAVDTCLGSSGEWPYQYVGQPGQRDGSWVC